MDISYAAGLIDGEGYIGIQEAGGSMQLLLKVTMTDKGLPSLTAMHQTYGGHLAEDRPVGQRTRAAHVWRLNGRKAADLIERMQPMLLTKAEPARIALQFQEMIDAAPRRTNRQAIWSEEMHRRARIFRARIQYANRTGPDAPPPVLPPGRPLAVRQYGEWWEPDEDLFGPVEFAGRFPTSGLMVAGHIYPRHALTAASQASPGLLGTPRCADGMTNALRDDVENARGRLEDQVSQLQGGGSQHPDERKAGGHGPTLADEVEHLFPTPRATDGTKGGPNQRGSSGDMLLPSAVQQLLPTPTTQPMTGNGHARNLGKEVSLLTGAPTPPPSTDGRPSSGDPRQRRPSQGEVEPPDSPQRSSSS